MALFLVQHGKSLSKDVDPDQGLSKEGIAEVERIAAVAKEYSINVSQINYSTKTRARQTAEIFASALKLYSGVGYIVCFANISIFINIIIVLS